jgi:oxaloacetate decarboxylase alpha subunit
MLTNMENQLREQGAGDRLDEVLGEIPRVRQDLGYIPLVTPTSQIVGTQAVLNVLTGERYKSITKETAGVLRGEYGATPAPVNRELQQRVLGDGEEPISCRPADLIEPELDRLTTELERAAQERGLELAANEIEDVLIYALFPQVGLKFLEHRHDPDAFEPPPWKAPAPAPAAASAAASPPAVGGTESYRVEVEGRTYEVKVTPGGRVAEVAPAAAPPAVSPQPPSSVSSRVLPAPLAGTIVKVRVIHGQRVASGEVLMTMEAMKMETEVRAPAAGTVVAVSVKEGDAVQVGDPLLTLV